MIAEGKTDAQIVKFMTDRYGDFVLYKPPFKGNTVVLWVGPIVLLLLGFIALFYFIRRYSRAAGKSVEPLSPQEKERAAALLEGRDR
jgi:cytochrome c-type biogenesis protein CcmH